MSRIIRERKWLFVLALFPIIAYFFTIQKYAVNLPYADDYESILGFLVRFKTTQNSGERFLLLFSQHNEHRIFYSRLFYLCYYKLFGNVNFRHLIFLANIQLVFIYLIFYQFVKRLINKYTIVLFCMISLLLFDLNSYENANWAMSGMHNYSVVLLFLLSLYYYQKTKKTYLILAVFFQVVAAFTTGIIGGISLMLFNFLEKDKLKTICCSTVFIVCNVLFFIGYKNVHFGGEVFIQNVIVFFLHTLGANFGYKLGVFGAVFLILAFIWFFPYKNVRLGNSVVNPILSIAFFVVATIGAISVSRSGISMEVSYSTRYFIYPHLFVCIVFAFMLRKLDGTRWLRPAVAGCFIMFVAIYTVSYRYGTAGFARIRACIYDSNCYTDESIPRMQQIATDACNEGIFCTHLPAVKH